METREINQETADRLRSALRLEEFAELPRKLVTGYWEIKRCCDRLSEPVTMHDLALLAYSLGYGKETAAEKAPPSVVDLWRRKQLKYDAPVVVRWRGKELNATFKGVDGSDQPIVVLDGDGEERKLPAADVWLPELVGAGA